MVFQENERESITGLTNRLAALTFEEVERLYQNYQAAYIVQEEDTAEGSCIPVIEKDNYIWLLNSKYDPMEAAKCWAEQFDQIVKNENQIILVFGLGDGRAISELCMRKPKCKIIIYEPCQDIFWKVMHYPEVAAVLNHDNVYAVVKGICEEYFFHVMQQILDYSNYQLVIQAILPNYDRLFPNEYRQMLDAFFSVIELIIFTRNTEIIRGIEIQHNMYALANDMIEQYSVTQLHHMVQDKHLENVPAILVAAGPSLDKNVQELKNAEGKAFIMVVDTALNTVLEHGILPDMTMSIDSRKPLTLFRNEKFEQIPIALSLNSNQKVVKRNTARHFYEIDQDSYLHLLIEETGKKDMQLATGGSVANNALSLLIEMGFQTIILVGQDLAYPEEIEHTKAAYNSDADRVDPKKKKYIEVEDIYGNKVLTENNMNIYRKWMESYICAIDGLQVIDATEGGAKIAGTQIKPLKETIEEYCLRKIDRNMFFNSEETYFTNEQKEMLKKRIRQIPQEVEQLEKRLREGLKLYSELDRLNQKQKHQTSRLKKIMEKISAINEEIDAMAVSRMVYPYMVKTSYEVQGEVLKYSENDSVTKQMYDFVEQGTKLMHGYLDGILELRKDIPLILRDFQQDDSSSGSIE